MDNSIYSNLHEIIDSATTITIQSNDSENYNITPSRSSLRNLSYEQMKQDMIVKSLKRLVLNIINIFILFLSLPILVSNIIILTYKSVDTDVGFCVSKVINLNNSNKLNLHSYVPFSLKVYFITDTILSVIILLLIYYFINIGFQDRFCLNNYKNILRISKYFIILQIIWIILGILTIIDSELKNICQVNIYTFTYSNISTRGVLIIILACIVINNYYII